MTTDLELSVVVSPPSVKPPIIDTARISWATSLFYFGMLAGLYPLTFALQRVPRANQTGRLLGILIIIWSAICASTAAVTSYKTLYVQRFFLGFFEGVIPASFIIIISSYYTQEEQALRQSWWYSASPLFNIIGGGLNYGFSRVRGGDLKSWQYIYLFAGALTFGFGVFCFFFAPSTPLTAWFLSEDERFAAVERLRKEQTGVRCSRIKMEQVKESVTEDLAKTALVFIIMAAGYTINGAITGFGPMIVSTFNYTALEAILFQFPLGGLGFLLMIGTGWVATRYKDIRMIMVAGFCLPVIAGCVIIWKSEWSQVRAVTPVVGYTMTGFFCPVATLTMATAMSNVAGHTKKSFMSATIFVGYCVGNIVGPLMVVSETRAEHYPQLWLGLIIWYVFFSFFRSSLVRFVAVCTGTTRTDKDDPIPATSSAYLPPPRCISSWPGRTRKRNGPSWSLLLTLMRLPLNVPSWRFRI